MSRSNDNSPQNAAAAPPGRAWPAGKRFAFTVFDDTDAATLRNVGNVYRFLDSLGMRTTKSAWVTRGDQHEGLYPGETCEDPDYVRWLLELQSRGFEIGWHGATWHSVPREATLDALRRFRELFGDGPRTMANHTRLVESMYWGSWRLSGWRVPLYDLLTRCRNRGQYRGHVDGDPYFWGDACKERIDYVRNFVFWDINTLRACPLMPYHDPRKPYVNAWFASSDGGNVERFCRCISEKSQDRLEEQGGACIMYAHFALGFDDRGALHPEFQRLMTRLARKNGWFVPVATLLDHLAVPGVQAITPSQQRGLEIRWLRQKIFTGTS